MRPRVVVTIAFIAWILPGQAAASCGIETFAVEKTATCGRDACRAVEPPEDLARIRRGLYIEHVEPGSEYGSWWRGIDLDKSEVIEVTRYPARMVRELFNKARRAPNRNFTEIRRANADSADYVQRRPVPREALGPIVCAANLVWKEGVPRVSAIGPDDVVHLMDARSSKTLGAATVRTDAARELTRLVEILARRGTTAPCIVEPFGARKENVCDHSRCGPRDAPPELKAIRRGVMTETIAVAIFAPVRGQWLGVNVDTREFVSVRQHPNEDRTDVLEEMRQAKAPKSAVFRDAMKGYFHLVRKRTLSKPELDDIACAVNRAWRSPDLGKDRIADLVRGHYLRDGAAWKEFGGDSNAAGEGTELLRRLEELDERW